VMRVLHSFPTRRSSDLDGPSFHDGDFYKIMEGMASVYATTKDKKLDKQMDEAIAMIAKTQRDDGYIHTPVLIEERWGTLGPEERSEEHTSELQSRENLV